MRLDELRSKIARNAPYPFAHHLLDDPHLDDVGFFDVPDGSPPGIVRCLPQLVLFDTIQSEPDMPPPALGADSRAILGDCGYDEATIESLIAAKVIRAGSEP